MEIPENVTDAGARDCLQCTTALPNTERHLQVLTTPTVHLLIVASDIPEVVACDRKQSSCHRRTVRGADLDILLRTFAFLTLSLPFRHIMPVKVTIPGEATDLQKGGKNTFLGQKPFKRSRRSDLPYLEVIVIVRTVVEVLRLDHVDDRYQHTRVRFLDPVE